MQSYNFTRSVPVEEGYDVLVAGGGPAGSAAAVCAARLGAKVLLVEATGSLGGMSTSGLVNTFGPMGDGERTLVGGFTRELIETMHERGYLGPEVTPEYWITHYNRWIPFDPEALKRLLDEYCVRRRRRDPLLHARDRRRRRRTQRQRRDHQQRRRARSSRPRHSSTAPATRCSPHACGAECKVAGATGRSSRRRCARPSPASTGTTPPTTPTRGTDAIRER